MSTAVLNILTLEFWICLGFRISCFGFVAPGVPTSRSVIKEGLTLLSSDAIDQPLRQAVRANSEGQGAGCWDAVCDWAVVETGVSESAGGVIAGSVARAGELAKQ